jgi:hypothetical protein
MQPFCCSLRPTQPPLYQRGVARQGDNNGSRSTPKNVPRMSKPRAFSAGCHLAGLGRFGSPAPFQFGAHVSAQQSGCQWLRTPGRTVMMLDDWQQAGQWGAPSGTRRVRACCTVDKSCLAGRISYPPKIDQASDGSIYRQKLPRVGCPFPA